ncbi:MAG: N-formylglutamate deformylase [Propylenella sp.]
MSGAVTVARGSAPLIVSIPHTGTQIPAEIEADLVSPWLARKDTDWHTEKLYDFAPAFDATIIRTPISRTVIDVNRDPSGRSLYPGQATTGLAPAETFDGEPLYRAGREPDSGEVARRRRFFFDPYHASLAAEIERLRRSHANIVLYDCHSIRSVIPRLFERDLPHMNIGTNNGVSCDHTFAHAIQAVCDASGFSWVVNKRFLGGYITRYYGRPESGVHTIQMELACRSYLDEPIPHVDETNWPPPHSTERAAKMRDTVKAAFKACLSFARRAR